jgi:hypothetical protein
MEVDIRIDPVGVSGHNVHDSALSISQSEIIPFHGRTRETETYLAHHATVKLEKMVGESHPKFEALLVRSDGSIALVGVLSDLLPPLSIQLNITHGVATAVVDTCSRYGLKHSQCLELASLVDAGSSEAAQYLMEIAAAEATAGRRRGGHVWIARWKPEDENLQEDGDSRSWETCTIYDRRGHPHFSSHQGSSIFHGPHQNCLKRIPSTVSLMALLLEKTVVLTGSSNSIAFSDLRHFGLTPLETDLALGVQKSFLAADEHCSNMQPDRGVAIESPQHYLEEEEFSMEGMSGDANRVLMNVLTAEVNAAWGMHELQYDASNGKSHETRGIRYLEIGSYKGSTLAASLCGNTVARAVSVDDFSEFGGKFDILQDRVKRCEDRATWVGSQHRVEYEVSRFQDMGLYQRLVPGRAKVDLEGVEAMAKSVVADWDEEEDRQRFELLLYDGPHAEQDHFDAVHIIPQQACRKLYVLVVDDWNWEVRPYNRSCEGTC